MSSDNISRDAAAVLTLHINRCWGMLAEQVSLLVTSPVCMGSLALARINLESLLALVCWQRSAALSRSARQLQLLLAPVLQNPELAVSARFLEHFYSLQRHFGVAPVQVLQQQLHVALAQLEPELEAANWNESGDDYTASLPLSKKLSLAVHFAGTCSPLKAATEDQQLRERLAFGVADRSPETLSEKPCERLRGLLSWQYLSSGQQAMPVCSASSAASLDLLSCFRQLWLQTLDLTVQSDWTLTTYLASGLAQHSRALRIFAQFCPNEHWLLLSVELEQALLSAHLLGCRPQAVLLQQWLGSAYRQAFQGFADLDNSSLPALNVDRCGNQLDIGAAHAQWRHWTECLEASVKVMAAPSDLLFLSYKLAWHAQAAGAAAQFQRWYCLYQVLVQYSALGRDLPERLRSLLGTCLLLPLDLSNANSGEVHLPSDILACWPSAKRHYERLVIINQPELSAGYTTIRHAKLPALLSSATNRVVERFEHKNPGSVQALASSSVLRYELSVLERGAAAMKLFELEALCSKLLQVYSVCAFAIQDEQNVASVLLRGHKHLLKMLDQAAAWQAPLADLQLNDALDEYLHQVGESQQLPASDTDDEVLKVRTAGLASLFAYVRQLGLIMERPLRLQLNWVNCAAAMPFELIGLLKSLIRILVLSPENDPMQRRAQHKPLTNCIELLVSKAKSDRIDVSVWSDSFLNLPPLESALNDLRARLPEKGSCTVEGTQGNLFWIRLVFYTTRNQRTAIDAI